MSWHVRFGANSGHFGAWLTGITSTPGSAEFERGALHDLVFAVPASRETISFLCKHAPGADDAPRSGPTRLTQSVVRATACQPLIQF